LNTKRINILDVSTYLLSLITNRLTFLYLACKYCNFPNLLDFWDMAVIDSKFPNPLNPRDFCFCLFFDKNSELFFVVNWKAHSYQYKERGSSDFSGNNPLGVEYYRFELIFPKDPQKSIQGAVAIPFDKNEKKKHTVVSKLLSNHYKVEISPTDNLIGLNRICQNDYATYSEKVDLTG
jgi:hypothetical protein